jgi:hypothetical protein
MENHSRKNWSTVSQENTSLSPGSGAYSPRAIRGWSVFLVAAGFFVAVVVTIRAGLGRVDQWLLGDWLIDYSAGFTRRGLIGEAVRQLGDAFGLDRIIVTTLIQLSVLAALMAMVLALVVSHQRGLTTLMLVASPAFVLFLLNPLGTMRKEIVLWLVVAAVLVWSKSGRFSAAQTLPWVVAIAFPLLVLVHEALLFYGGFVAVLMWLLVAEGTVAKTRALWAGAVGAVLTAVAGAVSLLWPSRPHSGADICATLTGGGYSDALCAGAIGFLDQDAALSLHRVVDAVATGNYLGVYIPVIILSSLPFFFVQFSRPLAYALGLSLAVTIPLFVVAIDWGRWIVVSVWLITLLVLRFDGSTDITVLAVDKTRRRLLSLATPAGVIAFATLWSVPHCCEPRIGFGVIDRFAEVVALLGLG